MPRRSDSRCCSLSQSHHLEVFYVLSELSVGMTTEGIDIHSVGNTLVLHQTALVEAFNLKAAIEYQRKNCKRAELLPRRHFKLPCSANFHFVLYFTLYFSFTFRPIV